MALIDRIFFGNLFYRAGLMAGLTGMADTSVVDFNAHLTSLWGGNLNVLKGQRRTGFPGDRSLSTCSAF